MPPPSPFATLLQSGTSGPADSSAGTARAPSPLLVRTTAGVSRPASAASLHSADGSERAGRAAGSQYCGTRPGPRRSVVSESSTASITLEGVVSQVDAGCCDLRPPGGVFCMCCQFCAATAIAGQLAPPSCEASRPLLHRTPGNAVNICITVQCPAPLVQLHVGGSGLCECRVLLPGLDMAAHGLGELDFGSTGEIGNLGVA